MNRKFVSFIIVLGISAAAWMSWQKGTSEEDARPKLTGLPIKAARYYWPGMYWVEIADKKGWFKEAGLNVELIDANPDYYKSLEDIASGVLDTNNFYLFDLLRYNLKGAGLVGVVYTDTSFGIDGIVAKQGIDTVRALQGKTIGVTLDSSHEYILSIVLQRNSLRLEDVTLVDMPGEKTLDAFLAGKIDAFVSWEPLLTEAVDKGKGIRLFDTSEIPGALPAVTVFSRKFIEERPADAQVFIGVWHKTAEFIKKNPQEAFEIIADIYKKSFAEAAGLAQMDKIVGLDDNVIAFSYGAGFESLHGAMRRINRFMLKKGIADIELDTLELLDDRFIHALQRERE